MSDVQHILVTGNMGYVGPVAIKQLRQAYPGAYMRGLDSGYFAHCLTGAEQLPERYFNVQHFLDIRDIPPQLLKDVDAIVHLAAISNDPMGNAFEAITEDINYKASVRLAQLAKTAGVKSFIFASSCSVYGYAEGEARSEKSELNPLTAYARSKIATEQAIQDLANEEFIITSLRFPTACGMSERLRLDLVLNDFVAAAVATGTVKILSDGTPWRPLIDVKDMARAFEWAIQRSVIDGGPFLAVNVGRTEWNYQIRDLAEAVREIMPGTKVNINKDAQPDRRSYRVDFSLYRELAPNHLPEIDIYQSVRNLAEGLQRIGFEDAGFRESNYIRLQVLRHLRERGFLGEDFTWNDSRGRTSLT